ncbi:MAG: PAS domain-containing sensor histidine kinase [Chloroflexi bacterium]|uniref:PAS domain-containing sensor histidine kinase n=1 Tax=Candidatus Flexifilum breve TaxID=3140694 RepID=UPI003135246D|nr:PAS domain-containing sensor histidine kinase [Chloroflexota bacterium]
MSIPNTYQQLLDENAALQARLKETEATLEAIRRGEVDALVVSTEHGRQVYTLEGADQPYRLLIEEMQQGAVTIAPSGIILYTNHFFCEFLGYAPTELIAHCIEDYVAPSEQLRLRQFLAGLATQTSLAEEFAFRHHNELMLPTYVLGNTILIEQTRLIYLVVIDLRQRKLLEQQTVELEVEKQRAKLLTDVMRNLSHDLRTPLATIITSLYIVQRTADEQRRHEKFAEIEEQVFHLSHALEQLQHMVRLDSLNELTLQVGSLNDLILRAVDDRQRDAAQQAIEIVAAITPDRLRVHFDAELIREAINELLLNAIRFSPVGGAIHVCYECLSDGHCLLEVTNAGAGIPAERLRHIFERFYKADEARSQHPSLGLGLSMVKRIIELHHGHIDAQSTPNGLTRFRITLPLAVNSPVTA